MAGVFIGTELFFLRNERIRPRPAEFHGWSGCPLHAGDLPTYPNTTYTVTFRTLQAPRGGICATYCTVRNTGFFVSWGLGRSTGPVVVVVKLREGDR